MPSQPTPDAAPAAPVSIEDAGSQALADALRSSFGIVKVIMAILAIAFFCSGIFTVPSQSVAVILRFGRPIGVGEGSLLQPGLHFAFPYPIDEVVIVPIGQSHSVSSTVGWYATTPELELTNSENPAGESLNPAMDGYVLTADGNIIHVRSTLRYRIDNPIRYAFNFANGTNANLFAGASNILQNALNSALFHTAARFNVDNALRDQVPFKERVFARVNQLIDEQGLGVTLETGDLQIIPPRQVQDKFKQVLDEQQNLANARDTARGTANEIISKAKGEAAAIVNTAEAARTRLVQAVEAEANYFSDQLVDYRRDPKLYLQRVQTRTLTRVMTNAQEKFFLPDRADGKARELRLMLSREPQKPKEQEAPKQEGPPLTKGDPRKK
ncbi:MAG: protease modulator HflK [Verrucomicrobia bacterium]|nr:protease modulator HflK [Verrucomicrobiota bacterium]